MLFPSKGPITGTSEGLTEHNPLPCLPLLLLETYRGDGTFVGEGGVSSAAGARVGRVLNQTSPLRASPRNELAELECS